MEENNVHFAGALTTAVISAIAAFYEPLEWWMLLALALIIADLRFGVLAAKARGEKVRKSRMWRRTLNKAFDYFCWVTVAGMCSRSMGKVMGAPVVSIGILFIIYGIEINSCVNNYLEYKGITTKRFNFWGLLKDKPEGVIKETEEKTEHKEEHKDKDVPQEEDKEAAKPSSAEDTKEKENENE